MPRPYIPFIRGNCEQKYFCRVHKFTAPNDIMKNFKLLSKSTFAIALLASGCAYAAPAAAPTNSWGTMPLGPNVPPLKWTPAEIKHPLQSHFKSFPATGERLVFTDNGKPLATIVISLHASDSSQEAAAVLQKTFQEISGVKLPLITDNKLTSKANPQDIVISLGDTNLSQKANIKSSDLLAGGYRIKTEGKVLFIVGNDVGSVTPANGTRNGVYALLEKHFGCRMAGRIGRGVAA